VIGSGHTSAGKSVLSSGTEVAAADPAAPLTFAGVSHIAALDIPKVHTKPINHRLSVTSDAKVQISRAELG
jgi:hypothetical protein